jgi:DNA polymerase-1
VLEKLADDFPLPAKLLEHRSLSKLKGTYTDKLGQLANPRTGRVHTHYAQAVAVTGRLSSNDPNLQNIPIRTAEGRRVREAFVAPPGSVIASADYSQIELRIMAHISGDESLLRAFTEGLDVHRATAAEVFGVEVAQVSSEQRRYAKVINFGLIYGMSSFGLAKQPGHRNQGRRVVHRPLLRALPGREGVHGRDAHERQGKGLRRDRVRPAPLPARDQFAQRPAPRRRRARRHQRADAGHGGRPDQAQHGQGAGRARREQRATKMIMQVHDELVFEVPEAEVEWVRSEIPKLMAGVADLKVPLLAELGVGPNWDKAH